MLNSFHIVGKLLGINDNAVTVEVPLFPGNQTFEMTTTVDPGMIAQLKGHIEKGTQQMVAISGGIVPHNGTIALNIKEITISSTIPKKEVFESTTTSFS